MRTLPNAPFCHEALLAAVLSLVVLLVSAPSRASTSYPEALAEELNAPCVPQCTICHRDNNGGLATVTQPFGLAMIANGLGFFAPQTIRPALNALEAAGTDSDGDGMGDVAELAAGRDPNGDLDLCGLAPHYGCAVRLATPPRRRDLDVTAWTLASLAFAAALSRRTRNWRSKRRLGDIAAQGHPARAGRKALTTDS